MSDENVTPEPEENEVEIEAHAAEPVLDLQKISIDTEDQAGLIAFSCSSCGGASC